MREIKVDNLEPGMHTAQTVCSPTGQILMVSGTRLSQSMIVRLQELNIVSILITDAQEAADEVAESILAKTYEETSEQLQHTLSSMFENSKLNISELRGNVEFLIHDFLNKRSILTGMYYIKELSDYAVHHAIQVCIMSLVIGMKLEYSTEQLIELGIGALLHDIGMAKLDSQITDKAGTLNNEEFTEIQQHSSIGFEIVQGYNEISLLASNTILQHHERWNGSGYPNALKSYEIHEYARIVAVADVFSALTSDRPYRQGYTFDEAVEYITTLSKYYFDPRIVDAFLSSIVLYPVNSIVVLTSGEFGQVVDVHPQVPTLPTVKIICDSNLKMAETNKEINLYKSGDHKVAHILNRQQTALFLTKTKSIAG